MAAVLECVPNFSEGRDLNIIKQITDQVESVDGVKLLDVDPGASTNRTVVTFVGEPQAVVDAAFLAIKKAGEVIDMRKHKGTHPRMGATDVCPLIPISGISAEEAVKYAHQLARRVGEELGIPVYFYEKAATSARAAPTWPSSGQANTKASRKKSSSQNGSPTIGPQKFNARCRSNRHRGARLPHRLQRQPQHPLGAPRQFGGLRRAGKGPHQDRRWQPHREKSAGCRRQSRCANPACANTVKGIGWYVEEYGIAQVSANLTNIEETPVHVVFEEARKSATRRGLRVTGSELIGLTPKKCLVEAGLYYLAQQGVSQGVSEEELIHIAVKSLGLDELAPFDPQKKVIEYQLSETKGPLVSLDLRDFNNLLASDAPAPGGGSVAALVGALGASLGTMVANLSGNKRGWDDRTTEFNPWAIKGQKLKDQLLALVDEDTAAFNKVMAAFKLPKSNDAEKAARQAAIEKANQYAARVPLRIMQTASECYPLLAEMAQNGNPNSITDAGVGALCVHAAVVGAGYNVQINLSGTGDETFEAEMRNKVQELEKASAAWREKIAKMVQEQF
jgi:glutamate formiminotransferase/formiminotetrahydrofolate cyclodeaminase